MKDNAGCGIGLVGIGLTIIVAVAAAGLVFSLAAGSFGRSFAEGGGHLEVFSDDIEANNYGDGVAVAAKDSEVHVENTVNQKDFEDAKAQDEKFNAFCGLVAVALIVIGMVGLWVNSNIPDYD